MPAKPTLGLELLPQTPLHELQVMRLEEQSLIPMNVK